MFKEMLSQKLTRTAKILLAKQLNGAQFHTKQHHLKCQRYEFLLTSIEQFLFSNGKEAANKKFNVNIRAVVLNN